MLLAVVAVVWSRGTDSFRDVDLTLLALFTQGCRPSAGGLYTSIPAQAGQLRGEAWISHSPPDRRERP